MNMQHWTPEQWAVFTVTVAAGIVAAAVLATLQRRRWTAPALHRVRSPQPRPTVVRAAARVPVPAWTDPQLLHDFTDPGIGALSSIQAITVDPTLRTSAELHAELDAWVNAYADLSASMPETAKATEQMRVNLEPVFRTARLWRLQGEGSSARQQLNDWRIGTKTGEWPLYDRQHRTAHALLVS
ncbi:MAG: hypothetical protein ABW046_22675 [Actinoplanes sp.]